MRRAAPFSAILVVLLLMAGLPAIDAVAAPGACPASRDVSPATWVDHYLFDPVFRRSWAVVRDCRYPAGPLQLVPVDGQPAVPAAGHGRKGMGEASGAGAVDLARPASLRQWVLSGSRVRLWETGAARIQLSGIAVESAPPGAEVTVRAGDRGVLLRGLVRGADSVELDGSVKGWREQE